MKRKRNDSGRNSKWQRLTAHPYHRQICAECGGKVRYEVRQQNGNWMVWDSVNDCAVKAVDRHILSDSACHTLKQGLLVLKSDSVTIQARPAMFWTQKEAQEWTDTCNDLNQTDN